MKNMLVIALLLVSSTVMAQKSKEKFKIEKGQWFLGGSGSVYYSDSEYNNESRIDGNNYHGFSIKPEIGHFVGDNIVIGLKPGYSSSKYEDELDGGEDTTKEVSITAYTRKYFSLGEKLAFNIQAEVFFSEFDRELKEVNSLLNGRTSKGNTSFIGLRPGVTYGLTNKIFLNANFGTLGYSKRKSEFENNTSKNNSFSFNLNTSDLYLGFLFLL